MGCGKHIGRVLGLAGLLTTAGAIAQDADWSAYLGGRDSGQYSALDQINTGNVSQLEVAWTYSSESGNEKRRGQIQCNPLVIDGVLYGVSPFMRVFALDAATGAEKWSFIPEKPKKAVARGFGWWTDGTKSYLLYGGGPHLYSLNPETGQPVAGFGEGGKVRLDVGLDRDPDKIYAESSSPGVVYNDLYIIGLRTMESHPAAPGYIRAYNVHTGAIEWTFRTIPQPGELGYDSWPEDAYTFTGGANSWAGMSLDVERGIVYVPTGAAAFDFYGGDRHGDNLFANTLLALDAATGERKWHFQTVHHDLWDRDLPAPPNLLTVEHDGKKIDAVAQITKSALVFLFDRETGEPLFPIEEIPVPASDLVGELASTTQPVPVRPEPFSRSKYEYRDLPDLDPDARDLIMKRWAGLRKERFAPPSREGTLVFPGYDGGGEWGGAAVDPDSGVLYINASEMPWILTMVDINELGSDPELRTGAMIYAKQCLFCHGVEREGNPHNGYPPLQGIGDRLKREDAKALLMAGKAFMPAFPNLGEKGMKSVLDFIYAADEAKEFVTGAEDEAPVDKKPIFRHTGWNRFVDAEGHPAIAPPWGTLNAIDMNTGKLVWKAVLGDTPSLRDRGWGKTGTENYGGPVATKGGIIFIGATNDEMFHAYDKETGKLLWNTKLPAGGYATPATYMVDGVQYVVVAAAGGKMGSAEGDKYVAFRLK
jgi:quinoprotein glucose dehydrogenase